MVKGHIALAILLAFNILIAKASAEEFPSRPKDIATAIRHLINGENVEVNRPAAEAGLTILDAGGDFADGVIAYEGSWLGADTFVSFDKRAVKLMDAQGQSARLLP